MMNLFEDIEAENDKYINIIDALEALSHKVNYGVSDIAKRLLLDNFNQIACMFKMSDLEQIKLWCSEKESNRGYSSTTEFLELAISTHGTFDHIEMDTYGNEYEHTKDDWADYYWLKSDFFEFSTVKKLNLTDAYFNTFLKERSAEVFSNFLIDMDIASHQNELKDKANQITQNFFNKQNEFLIANPNQLDPISDTQQNQSSISLKEKVSLKDLLKSQDEYISVLEIFELIKVKTDLKSDQEIAHFLQTIGITKKSTPFSKVKYFKGKPVELFRDYQNKTLTEMDLLLIELSSGEICINSNDLRLKNFVFDKLDFFFEFRDITNLDLDSEDVDQADSFEQTQQNNEIPLFYLNDTFSLIEAACVLSGDNSIQMNRCFNDTNFDQNYPDFNEAYSFICSAVQAGRFAGDLILADDLKSYLKSKGKIIDGFNDQLKNEVTDQNLNNQNSIIDQLKKENERLKRLLQKNESESVELAIDLRASENTLNRITTKNEELKAELVEKDERIKELETLQSKDTDLLSLIFDETAAERYAPDLVLSIKLWEYTYIKNPKNDSHSNKADTWLKNNTGYDTTKKAGSASKIREITAPFINWSIHRDKTYKK